MTVRFSLFSHIEDIETGQLVLTDPFKKDGNQPSVCRYDIHLQSKEVLEPDIAWRGAAKFHQLLPLDQEETRKLNHIPVFNGSATASFLIDGSNWQVNRIAINPLLPLIITGFQVQKSGFKKVLCPLLGFKEQAFLNGFEGSDCQFLVPKTWKDVFPDDARIRFVQDDDPEKAPPSTMVNIGPWRHPFRIEGMKLIGLELLQQYQEPPTIILHDPSGEWTFALLEVAQLMRFFNPTHPPFRIILVQLAPYDHLCQLFEGRSYDGSNLGNAPLPAYRPIPPPVGSRLIQGLMTLGGTALSIAYSQLQAPSASLAQLALEPLVRTGFVDEEDRVIFLDPYGFAQTDQHHCGDSL